MPDNKRRANGKNGINEMNEGKIAQTGKNQNVADNMLAFSVLRQRCKEILFLQKSCAFLFALLESYLLLFSHCFWLLGWMRHEITFSTCVNIYFRFVFNFLRYTNQYFIRHLVFKSVLYSKGWTTTINGITSSFSYFRCDFRRIYVSWSFLHFSHLPACHGHNKTTEMS